MLRLLLLLLPLLQELLLGSRDILCRGSELIPNLYNFVRDTVDDVVASLLVVPNVIAVPLARGLGRELHSQCYLDVLEARTAPCIDLFDSRAFIRLQSVWQGLRDTQDRKFCFVVSRSNFDMPAACAGFVPALTWKP